MTPSAARKCPAPGTTRAATPSLRGEPVGERGGHDRVGVRAEHGDPVDLPGDRADVGPAAHEAVQRREAGHRLGESRDDHQRAEAPTGRQRQQVPQHGERAEAVRDDHGPGVRYADRGARDLLPPGGVGLLGIGQRRYGRGEAVRGQPVGEPAEPVVGGRGAVPVDDRGTAGS
ncbi:hypothetical protein [Nocardioides convexus]|uniref:hypothetical protein n=1 Tax=Nocardioides convexus TaxID=2712224 RepID=UPI0024188B6D|nr:hypothetical protein [Nocardioides convexus]